MIATDRHSGPKEVPKVSGVGELINVYWGMATTGVTFNIVPIFQSQGLSELDAAGLLGIFALTLAVTHLVGGLLADRLPLHWLLTVAACSMSVLMYGLSSLHLPSAVIVCGVAMGVAQGLSTGLTSVICARYFGRLHLGQIRSLLSTGTIAASSIGPFLVGLTCDLSGSYTVCG